MTDLYTKRVFFIEKPANVPPRVPNRSFPPSYPSNLKTIDPRLLLKGIVPLSAK